MIETIKHMVHARDVLSSPNTQWPTSKVVGYSLESQGSWAIPHYFCFIFTSFELLQHKLYSIYDRVVKVGA